MKITSINNSLALITFGFLTGIMFGHFLWFDKNPSSALADTNQGDNEQEITQLTKTINQLQREIERYQTETSPPHPTSIKDNGIHTNKNLSNTSKSSIKNNENRDLEKEMTIAFKTLESMQKLKEKPAEEIESLISKSFDNQSIDIEWATKENENLYSIFSSDTSLSQHALKDITCKTKSCRLTFYISDYNQANKIISDLSDAMPSLAPNHYAEKEIFAAPDVTQGLTQLYVNRVGYSLFDYQ